MVLNPMGLKADVQQTVMHVHDVTNFEPVAAVVAVSRDGERAERVRERREGCNGGFGGQRDRDIRTQS